jgi:hypothetical protein
LTDSGRLLKYPGHFADQVLMLMRFVSDIPDPENSHEPAGLFMVASWVRDRAEAGPSDLARLQSLRAWFNEHLERPRRFNRSRRPHRREKAISWFKDSALEHIQQAREMAAIVGTCGYVIREVRTRRPGYVVYEDEFQVVAEPFAETVR